MFLFNLFYILHNNLINYVPFYKNNTNYHFIIKSINKKNENN